MDPILDDLNDAQRGAVMFGEGPLMVLAGAGSGKTRVITRRIARLLRDGIPADSILAVTFTNKAAQEMARRVEDLGGRRVHISTFHSACARFLRADGHHLGYPRDYSIFDTYDRDVCVKMLMAELGLESEGVKPSHVGQMISRLKNAATSPEDFVEAHRVDDPLTVEQITAALYGPYQDRLRRLGAMDFDDLLLRFLELLREHPEVRDRYRARFAWLLVDEFQDTNGVQYELTKELAASHRNVCVVGDPDQSIYRFRGAEIRNILDFQADWPDVHIARLEINYRSTRRILAAAQGIIVHNRQRLERDLGSDGPEGDRLVYRGFANPFDENDAVCREVVALLQRRVSPSEIAVFYRSHFLSRGLEEVMRRAGVPYEVVGGLSFFERREIKDLLAYLRVLVNPLDDLSMARIVNVPPRGIGKVTLENLRGTAAAERMSLYEVVMDTNLHASLRGAARGGVQDLAAVFEHAQRDAELGAAAALAAVLDRTQYVDYAANTGDPQDVAREENIGELQSDAADFDRRFGGGLAAYLAHVSLLTSEDRRARAGPTVSLMTIHAAKGLEFDHVFVVGFEDGLLPSSRSTGDDDLEEERRLLYVALTRARKTVMLSSAERRMLHGAEIESMPSRFLGEIPDECLDAPRREKLAWKHWEPEPEHDEPGHDIRPKMHVRHPDFGRGVVARVSGRGVRARAVVRFGDGSERTLLLEYETLHVLDGEGEW